MIRFFDIAYIFAGGALLLVGVCAALEIALQCVAFLLWRLQRASQEALRDATESSADSCTAGKRDQYEHAARRMNRLNGREES